MKVSPNPVIGVHIRSGKFGHGHTERGIPFENTEVEETLSEGHVTIDAELQ